MYTAVGGIRLRNDFKEGSQCEENTSTYNTLNGITPQQYGTTQLLNGRDI